MEEWVSDRQESLEVLATAVSPRLATNQTRTALGALDHNYDEFSLIELTDLTGKVLATSRGGVNIDVAGQDWVSGRRGWSAGRHLTVPPRRSHPVDRCSARDGSPRPPSAIVIGDLHPSGAEHPAQRRIERGATRSSWPTTSISCFTAARMGEITDDVELLAAGCAEHPRRQCRDPAGIQHR